MPFAELTDEFGQVSAFVSPGILQRGPDGCGIVRARVLRPPFAHEFLEACDVVGVAEPFGGKVSELSNLFFRGGHCAKAPISEQSSSDWYDTYASFRAAVTCSFLSWRPNSQPAGFSRHDTASNQRLPMAGKNQLARSGLFGNRTVYEPDNPAVLLTADDHQLAEVFVEGDKNASLGRSVCEDGGITRVGNPVADPLDVVTQLAEGCGGLSGNAGVEQQPHEAEATGNISHRSCPTSLRANARHARTSSGSSQG